MAYTLKIGEATKAAAIQFLLRHGLSLITKKLSLPIRQN